MSGVYTLCGQAGLGCFAGGGGAAVCMWPCFLPVVLGSLGCPPPASQAYVPTPRQFDRVPQPQAENGEGPPITPVTPHHLFSLSTFFTHSFPISTHTECQLHAGSSAGPAWGLGGEGLVHAFLEPECGQEPAPGQAGWQAVGGARVNPGIRALLCAPLWWWPQGLGSSDRSLKEEQ